MKIATVGYTDVIPISAVTPISVTSLLTLAFRGLRSEGGSDVTIADSIFYKRKDGNPSFLESGIFRVAGLQIIKTCITIIHILPCEAELAQSPEMYVL